MQAQAHAMEIASFKLSSGLVERARHHLGGIRYIKESNGRGASRVDSRARLHSWCFARPYNIPSCASCRSWDGKLRVGLDVMKRNKL